MTVRKSLSRSRDARSDERGAAIVEFALVAPVLIMIMMGVVQLGLLLHQQQAIHAAAREGARRGSFPGADVEDIEDSIDSALNGINLSGVDVKTITRQPAGQVLTLPDAVPCDETAVGADSVTVNIQVATRLDIPFFAGQNVNLTGEGTFRCEYLG